jgi:hypothetical protein
MDGQWFFFRFAWCIGGASIMLDQHRIGSSHFSVRQFFLDKMSGFSTHSHMAIFVFLLCNVVQAWRFEGYLV